MNQRQVLHVGILVVGGLAVRAWLFMDVGVNGDTGLYLYDAKQILWGHRIFIDFPSRSPVFEYALAGVLSLGYSPILSARAFMVGVGLALGVAVYALGRRLHTHRAGLAAAALFYLTPFPAVWGLWVKTEQAAGLLLVSAFVIALGVVDRDRLPTWAVAAVGLLFGLAFLVRRVAIVHIGAFAIFMAYYRLRHVQEWRSTIAGAAGVVAVALLTLLAVYAGLAGFDPGLTAAVGESHGLALFQSDGQGGLGWIEVYEDKAVTAEDRNSLLATICQKCGENTVTVFIVTILLTLPALLPLLVLLRSYLAPAGVVGNIALPAAFAVSGLWGIVLVALTGAAADSVFWARAIGAIVLVTSVLILWRLDPIPFDQLWRPKFGLPILVLLSLTAGYLYRDRILYVTYFQDFYPYMVTLSGILSVEFYDHYLAGKRRPLLVGAVIVMLVLSMGVGISKTYPHNPDDGVSDRSWFSVELVQEYGADINARTAPGDRVLTAQPLYVIESDRRIVRDLSRRYYLFEGWPDTSTAAREEVAIVEQLRDESTRYVILDDELRTIYEGTKTVEPTVDCYFTVAEYQGHYDRKNATLLERKPNVTDCQS